EDPRIARDRLYSGMEHELVSPNLRDRAGASDSLRLSAEQFSDYYDIVLDKDGDDWHASPAPPRRRVRGLPPRGVQMHNTGCRSRSVMQVGCRPGRDTWQPKG